MLLTCTIVRTSAKQLTITCSFLSHKNNICLKKYGCIKEAVLRCHKAEFLKVIHCYVHGKYIEPFIIISLKICVGNPQAYRLIARITHVLKSLMKYNKILCLEKCFKSTSKDIVLLSFLCKKATQLKSALCFYLALKNVFIFFI